MRVYQDKNVEVVAQHDELNEEISFEISSNDEVIIDMLRRNYAYPIQTPVQEYLCNARDAMREAKNNDGRIVVTLPNAVDATFKVRDYGVGLSPERVRKVFTKYGESTKRGNNDQTGGYGIGAKSAFIYADSFTVISYFEGVKYTYLAIRSKNKQKGSFNCVKREQTSEANGVEVRIPVKPEDFNEFARSTYRATFFWKNRPELKGISEFEIPKEYSNPKFFYENEFGCFADMDESFGFGLVEKPKNSYLYQTYHNSNSKNEILVVDGIPYKNPFESIKNNNLTKNGNLIQVFFFNTGEFTLPPHREEIVTDKKNDDFALTRSIQFIKQITKDVNNSLEKCSDISCAFDIITDLMDKVDQKTVLGIAKGSFKKFTVKPYDTTTGKYQVPEIPQYSYSNNCPKMVIEPKSPMVIQSTIELETTYRSKKVKEMREIHSPKGLIVSFDSDILYVHNNDGEEISKILPRIKRHINEGTKRKFVQIIGSKEQYFDLYKKSSSLIVERVKKETSSSPKRTNEIVYFELSEKAPNDNIYYRGNKDDDKIARTTKTLLKTDSSDISDCVFVETEQNNLYKKYGKDEILLQSIMLYLIKNGVTVIAFAEKNRDYFENGIDFKDVVKDVFTKFPLSQDMKNSYFSEILQKEMQSSSDCLFGNFFDYLGNTEIFNLISKLKNKDVKHLLVLKNLSTREVRKKERFFDEAFINHTISKSLREEIDAIKESSKEFLKNSYALKFNNEICNEGLSSFVKYVNETNK